MATSSTVLHSSHSVAKTFNIKVPRVSFTPFVLPALVTASGIALTTISFIPFETTRIFTDTNWIARRSIEILKFGAFPKITGCILTLVGGLLLYKAGENYRIKTFKQETTLIDQLQQKLRPLLKDNELFAVRFLSQKVCAFSTHYHLINGWTWTKETRSSLDVWLETVRKRFNKDRKFVTLDILTARLSQQT